MIYLDNAATTAVAPEVATVIYQALCDYPGNPSSTYQDGRRSKQQLSQARRLLAHSIGASEEQIIFTSCGSESNNLALIGVAEAQVAKGKHLITTAIEHPSVLATMKYLETRGFEVTYLPVDQTGRVSAAQVADALRDDTILVSVMAVNNETGTIMPIAEIAEVVSAHQALYHTDAVQAFGSIGIDVSRVPIDLLSVSAHKINGPKGIGFLYCRNRTMIVPHLHGGLQEQQRRAGTENIAYALGFAEAARLKLSQLTSDQAHLFNLRAHLLAQLTQHQLAFTWNVGEHDETAVAPHIMNLWLHGQTAQKLLIQLDLLNIAVSAGSACSAGALTPSPVLRALYTDEQRVSESIRVSFSSATTTDELDQFVAALVHIREREQQRK